jgi:alpha-1,2-mannosyltransferase
MAFSRRANRAPSKEAAAEAPAAAPPRSSSALKKTAAAAHAAPTAQTAPPSSAVVLPTTRRVQSYNTLGFFVLSTLIFARVAGAWLLPVMDCDETYNYWEPLHFLIYGTGKQTWEYANEFALRSWLFLWLYGWPAKLIATAIPLFPKPLLFYFVKALAAAATATAEWYLANGVARRFGARAGKVTFVVSLGCAGTALAAPAFLPSSFAMLCNMVALGAWLRADAICGLPNAKTLLFRPTSIAVAAASAGAILGWPFAALTAVPIAADLLVIHVRVWGLLRGLLTLCNVGFAIVLVCCAAGFLVDSAYYCRPVFSAWNLVKYNVLPGGAERGPELYGVEPWHFFFKNLTLNFGVVFLAAIASPLIWPLFALIRRFRRQSVVPSQGVAVTPRQQSVTGSLLAAFKFTSPFLLWFVFWLRVPHKEERFMAPVYGFIAVAAALVVAGLLESGATSAVVRRPGSATPPPASAAQGSKCGCGDTHGPGDYAHGHRHGSRKSLLSRVPRLLAALTLATALLGCTLRLAGMWAFYAGPERSAWDLHDVVALRQNELDGRGLTVCIGRDWFRFPSNFFVPHGSRYDFVKTKFNGALPKDFHPEGGSCSADRGFNDLNKEQPDQSVSAKDAATHCDYYVDSFVAGSIDELPIPVDLEAHRYPRSTRAGTGKPPTFTIVPGATKRMLDPKRTGQLCRLGYLPAVSEGCARWGDYFVLSRHPVPDEFSHPEARLL